MNTLQYIHLYIKNSITQTAHQNTFHLLRYVHFRFTKRLFTNIKKQENTLKSSLLFKKIQTLRVNNSWILRILNAKFSGYYFYMNINIWRDFQICISVSLIFVTLFFHYLANWYCWLDIGSCLNDNRIWFFFDNLIHLF